MTEPKIGKAKGWNVPKFVGFSMIPIGEIRPASHNRRRWSAKALKLLTVQIDRLGFNQPVVVNVVEDADRPYRLISGHMRLAAARRLSMKEIPAMVYHYETADDEIPGNLSANNRAAQGRYTADAPELADRVLKRDPESHRQLSLGLIRDQIGDAEAPVEKPSKPKKDPKPGDESLRTIKIVLPLSAYNVWMRAFTRAAELLAADDVDLVGQTDSVVVEKLCSSFLLENGEPQHAPQSEEPKR